MFYRKKAFQRLAADHRKGFGLFASVWRPFGWLLKWLSIGLVVGVLSYNGFDVLASTLAFSAFLHTIYQRHEQILAWERHQNAIGILENTVAEIDNDTVFDERETVSRLRSLDPDVIVPTIAFRLLAAIADPSRTKT